MPRTYRLVRRTVNVLLEGTPEGINVDDLEAAICAVPHVTAVHDLHAWLIGSGISALSVHVEVELEADDCAILDEVQDLLAERFDIHHATIQVERQPRKEQSSTADPTAVRPRVSDTPMNAAGIALAH